MTTPRLAPAWRRVDPAALIAVLLTAAARRHAGSAALAALLLAAHPLLLAADARAMDPAPRAAPPLLDVDASLAASYFAEARALSERDGGALWGRPLYGPMIFVDPATSTLVADRRDAGGALEADGEVFRGPVPAELGYANTAQSWAGELWTTVVWPLPLDRHDRAQLMAHEMFHRIQPDVAACPTGRVDNAHLDTEAGRTWLRLEWRALASALSAEGAIRRAALGDVLLFRARRHGLFPDAARQEAALVANEGLAEYTGLRLCALPDDVLPRRAASRLLREERGESFPRSFAYAAGPAYGLLLDAAADAGLRGDWRTDLEPTTDLVEVVARVYDLAPTGPVAERAAERATIYDGTHVFADEEAREARRAARIARYRARFVDGPVLTLPASGSVQYEFDPYRVESFPDRGQVYDVLAVRDAWGELEVTSGGALPTPSETGSVAAFRVPAPAGAEGEPIVGDGWSLTLAPGWRLAADAREGDVVVRR